MFDFHEARYRQAELISLYRRLIRMSIDDGTWDWWLKKQIKEIDAEISAQHAKMA